jgi:hypothetical protein
MLGWSAKEQNILAVLVAVIDSHVQYAMEAETGLCGIFQGISRLLKNSFLENPQITRCIR